MSNPYQFTTSNRIAHSKLRISAFWIGVRNGFLWSVLAGCVRLASTTRSDDKSSSSNMNLGAIDEADL